MSSLYRQWQNAKHQHPHALILVDSGDFCDTFNEDADRLAKHIGWVHVLTHDKYRVAGVPSSALGEVKDKLLREGVPVGVVHDPIMADFLDSLS